MPQGPRITDQVQAQIAKVYLAHPKWRAQEIRNEVSAILRKGRPELPPKWPGLSAVQKVLTTVRKRELEYDPQEKPWSLGTLDKFPIPPEALPAVLRVLRLRLQTGEGEGFTIRQAKWAARLSVAIGADMLSEKEDFSIREAKWAAILEAAGEGETLSDLYEEAKDPKKLATKTLSLWAGEYAHWELLHKLIGSDFNSASLDRTFTGLSSTAREIEENVKTLLVQLRGLRNGEKQAKRKGGKAK